MDNEIIKTHYYSDLEELDIDSIHKTSIFNIDSALTLLFEELHQIEADSKVKPDLYKSVALLIAERSRLIESATTKSKEELKLLLLNEIS